MDSLNVSIKQYLDEGWLPMMVTIWREKIERLKVVRTGALHESFKTRITNAGEGYDIAMRFLKYGIYQALGVGYGYRKKYVCPAGYGVYATNAGRDVNAGDLPFLGDDYRHQQRLDVGRRVGPAWGGYVTSGKPRDRRDWYTPKLYMSVMALKEDLARITGEEAASVICDAISDTRSALK